MNGIAEITGRLKDGAVLSAREYKSLLENEDAGDLCLLQEEAWNETGKVFGRGVFIRGLIEVSSHCRNNCLYCGLRASNTALERYRLDRDAVVDCCRAGYETGFRTFVLQGGEDIALTDSWLEDTLASIRSSCPGCAITLSLGERSEESYLRLRRAGADRYLLRHETFDADHYSRLHPKGMSRDRRLECLRALKRAGYQTGTGIMVGSPYQTTDNIVEDLLFIQDFHPEMIGIGPFIHHPQTPFAEFGDGSVGLTLKLISILRLMNPYALIPATTALATLDPEGRKKGIKAGANVVMPNLTPAAVRGRYDIYDGKAVNGAESAEGLPELERELASIGCHVAIGRGDAPPPAGYGRPKSVS